MESIITEHVPTITTDDITNNAIFADLGIDSLALIEIFIHIGDEYQLEFPPPEDEEFWEAHNQVACLNDLVDVVEEVKAALQSS